MPLPPSLVSGKTRITGGGLAPVGVAMAPAGGAAPVAVGGASLAFTMHVQEQDNWCWAATAMSVSLFYNSGSSWTQCTVANQILSLPTGVGCCPNGSIPACDVPWYLDRALAATSNLLDVRSGTVGFSDLAALIGSANPLGARIAWSGGGGHFVVLHGWKKTTVGEFVDVADPFNGSTSQVRYSDFLSSYRSTGSWTHSYWTN